MQVKITYYGDLEDIRHAIAHLANELEGHTFSGGDDEKTQLNSALSEAVEGVTDSSGSLFSWSVIRS
jgi:hypothetical protein